jgi:hypothetical protein
MIRLALLEQTANELQWLLEESAPDESGAFCLLREGKGRQGSRLIATEVLLPPQDAWERQGRGILRPKAKWISAAISCAVRAHAGLLFVHSHPDPCFPLGLSLTDLNAFNSLARNLVPTFDGPFGAAVVHPAGWAGVVWSGSSITPIAAIYKVGRTLQTLSPIEPLENTPIDDRQRDALGMIHDRLRGMDVGIVGCGGIGSPIAEQLVRMGVRSLTVVDFDHLDTPSNVRRNFGSTLSDLNAAIPPRKVDVIFRHAANLGLGVPVLPIHGDVRHEDVFRNLLDTDVVVCATDNHGSRAVVNDLASAYLLPVIDIGVRAGSKARNVLSALVAEVRILTPTTPCLWCRRAIDAQVIRAENLPQTERQKLMQEGYLLGAASDPEPTVVALTVLGAGLATCALLALLSQEADVSPSGYWVDGFLGDSQETNPKHPTEGCRCRKQLGLGDNSPPPFLRAD